MPRKSCSSRLSGTGAPSGPVSCKRPLPGAGAAMQMQQAVEAAFQRQAAPGLSAAQGLAGLTLLAPGGIAGEHGPQEGQTGGLSGFVVAQKNVDARAEAFGARLGKDTEAVCVE